MMVSGELLLGLPSGAFQTLKATYASEECPMVLRIYLTTSVNLCWSCGGISAPGILKDLQGNSHSCAYKIPFGLQWAWPTPIFIGIFLAPESPW